MLDEPTIGPHPVRPTPEQEARLGAYASLLAADGVRLGLIGPNEQEKIWDRHVLDSLGAAAWVAPDEEVRIADVGSGAGLPGIPVAVVRPLARVWLIESRQRRCAWARATMEAVGLDANVLCERAETVGRGRLRGSFGIVLSRAFANVAALLECSLPLLSPGGLVVALRGAPTADEVAAAREASGALGGSEPSWVTRSGGPGAAGHVLLVEKVAETPDRFPRRPGLPAKRPLRRPPDSGTMPGDSRGGIR